MYNNKLTRGLLTVYMGILSDTLRKQHKDYTYCRKLLIHFFNEIYSLRIYEW